MCQVKRLKSFNFRYSVRRPSFCSMQTCIWNFDEGCWTFGGRVFISRGNKGVPRPAYSNDFIDGPSNIKRGRSLPSKICGDCRSDKTTSAYIN